MLNHTRWYRLTLLHLLVVTQLLSVATPVGATMIVSSLSLDELTADAGCVVHATVTTVRSGRDAHGLPATWTTMDVHECLKGDAPTQLTTKQLGVRAPLDDGTILKVPGLPTFRPGEEVVLFLHDESAAGFTSPVGLAQGVYRVRYVEGEARVAREPGARTTVRHTQSLDAFKADVRRRAAAAR